MQKNIPVKKPINIYSKNVLARLLAVEGVSVIHDPTAPTAYIDLDTRCITIPVLKEMKDYTYNAFIAHECSHAIFTPYDGWMKAIKEEKLPAVIVNITEDARIEKLIQDRYPGLRKDFYDFYKDLSSPDMDFFGIKNLDLNELSLVDKINLHFKIGRFVKVPFSQEEQYYVNLVDKEVTFDDAVQAAKEIYDYMDKNNQITKISKVDISLSPKDGELQKSKKDKSQDGESDEIEVGITQKNYEKNRTGTMQVDPQTAKSGLTFGNFPGSLSIDVIKQLNIKTSSSKPSAEYISFLKSSSNTVNMMLSQFNMKKSAIEYRKIKQHTSGALDMNKLSQYKMRDDVFRSNDILPEAQNHGMIIIIDWSGSMSSSMKAVVQQLAILTDFCKRQQIKFSVYAFSDGASNKHTKDKKVLLSSQSGNVKIVKVIDSSMKKQEIDTTLSSIYSNPQAVMGMGGTPLVAMSMYADKITEQFIAQHGTQKNTLVLISDGGAGDSLLDGEGNKAKQKIIIHDKDNFENYEVKGGSHTFLNIFSIIKRRHKLHALIGIYIDSSFSEYSVEQFITDKKLSPEEKNKHEQSFREKSYAVIESDDGFDKYFVVDINNFLIGKSEIDITTINPSSSQNAKDRSFAAAVSRHSKLLFLKIFVDLFA